MKIGSGICLLGAVSWSLMFGQNPGPASTVSGLADQGWGPNGIYGRLCQTRHGAVRPPNFPLDAGDAFRPVGGHFSADFPLLTYISFAYKIPLSENQHWPDWVHDRFDIQAEADGKPTKDQMRLMMQSLLAERFQLKVHV